MYYNFSTVSAHVNTLRKWNTENIKTHCFSSIIKRILTLRILWIGLGIPQWSMYHALRTTDLKFNILCIYGERETHTHQWLLWPKYVFHSQQQCHKFYTLSENNYFLLLNPGTLFIRSLSNSSFPSVCFLFYNC